MHRVVRHVAVRLGSVLIANMILLVIVAVFAAMPPKVQFEWQFHALSAFGGDVPADLLVACRRSCCEPSSQTAPTHSTQNTLRLFLPSQSAQHDCDELISYVLKIASFTPRIVSTTR